MSKYILYYKEYIGWSFATVVRCDVSYIAHQLRSNSDSYRYINVYFLRNTGVTAISLGRGTGIQYAIVLTSFLRPEVGIYASYDKYVPNEVQNNIIS